MREWHQFKAVHRWKIFAIAVTNPKAFSTRYTNNVRIVANTNIAMFIRAHYCQKSVRFLN